jgi:hypothetical protein
MFNEAVRAIHISRTVDTMLGPTPVAADLVRIKSPEKFKWTSLCRQFKLDEGRDAFFRANA